MVDRLTKEFAGEVEFRVYVLDKDPSGEKLADAYGVQYVPTYVFVNSDGTKADQAVGKLSEEDFRKKVEALK